MALFLIKADSNYTHPDPVKDARGVYKRGDIIQVLDDSAHNGDIITNPIMSPFVMVRVIGLSVERALKYMEEDTEPGIGVNDCAAIGIDYHFRSAAHYLYNCTVQGCGTGIDGTSTRTTAKNCIVQDCTTCYTGTYTGSNNNEPQINQDYWIDGSLTATRLQEQVAAKAAALNTVVTVRGQISLGQVVSIVPPTPAAPTQAELDKANYFSLLSKWSHIKQDISNGLIAADDARVVQLETDLRATYKPEYSGL